VKTETNPGNPEQAQTEDQTDLIHKGTWLPAGPKIFAINKKKNSSGRKKAPAGAKECGKGGLARTGTEEGPGDT